jgi:thiamine-monophosphate kinase
VNLSDVASMGAEPRWALIALACPPSTTAEEVDAFYEGLLALAAEHGVALVGGDTASSPAGWLINVTLLGETTRSPLLRSGARTGDVVAVTGTLGRSAAGLGLLARRQAPAGADAAILADAAAAHLRPRPRVAEGRWLGHAGGVTAMIDVSDGLVTDLQHIAEESGVGARVELGRIPIADATRRLATVLRGDAEEWATSGGEDYELLLTCAAAEYDRLARGLEEATGTRLTAVGEVTEAGPVRFTDAAGREVRMRRGFEHFVREGPR